MISNTGRRISSGLVSAVALAISAYGLLLIQKFYLPFSPAVPLLNIVIAFMIAAVGWSWNAIISLMQNGRAAISISICIYLLLASALVLAVLSGQSVFPNDLETSRTENQWKLWFRSKDKNSIQSVQNQLHCCGFNSMRDRAWPFPAKGVDAAECQRSSGYLTNCGPLWQDLLRMAAGLSFGVSIMEELVLLSIVYSLLTIRASKQLESGPNVADTRNPVLPNVADTRSPLVGNVSSDVYNTFAEDRLRQDARRRAERNEGEH